ncbi:MAG: DUF2384 domain-containing protein [Rhodanobacteraceae bacterium]|nr:DUF2384 domain-containing protein [Rhodanobacteraceae bacterium]
MSTQRSWTPTWPSTLPESGTTPAPAQSATRPPAAPPRTPIVPPAPSQTRAAPAPNHYTAPAHQSNSAVLADLARQARAARGELQAAQEAFARRALALYDTLRIIDDSLVQLATHVLGNSVIAAAWFSSRNHHLNQRSPLEVLMVGDREAVVTELMRLEHGAY